MIKNILVLGAGSAGLITAISIKRKNPKIKTGPQIVRFRSGCYKRQWVDNVVAFGNAGGFVEPLKSTAIMILCSHIQTLVDFLLHTNLKPTPTMRALYNDLTAQSWSDIKDFLAIHYKFNGMLDTPFWRQAREETDVSGVADLLEFYGENGPTGFCRYRMPRTASDFGLEAIGVADQHGLLFNPSRRTLQDSVLNAKQPLLLCGAAAGE